MPKLKSNRGAAKRFRATKNGFKCKSANRNHILTSKSRTRKRKLRSGLLVDKSDVGHIKQMLPFA